MTIPSDQSIVRALAEAGLEIQTSCGQGVCGTCLTRVVEGSLDHRDAYLTPEEGDRGDYFLPCCSHS
ncbi:MAG: 2Fe-2S iron-sulfur cluster binding domain-containing protein [Betaproteobacteria bacterium]|nr:2Fe-2S iron-sulfur cluster binding domain-containing protein [Betaproteobacteria bacterium]MDE2122138.1 2Fe-2S iron-sulfur cluster binding domain-containing protein [Betaproteobacteria bacterium]MDE2186892.1 2Fe-2S iron-sulfur cluster binding domain-containing protein [Betaproteobacteria bacterium]MDE2323830.1 2Fe-2S iron-sulfur cluster binding domain-containing protein [Betaproteobacteria bacterium]